IRGAPGDGHAGAVSFLFLARDGAVFRQPDAAYRSVRRGARSRRLIHFAFARHSIVIRSRMAFAGSQFQSVTRRPSTDTEAGRWMKWICKAYDRRCTWPSKAPRVGPITM